jgi:hypothetical protein
MKITLTKPNLKKPNALGFLRFFYDYKKYATDNFPVGLKKIVVYLVLGSVATFLMYFMSSYTRRADLSNQEIARQVAFINYTLWAAYILFVVGINGLIYVLLRLLKANLDIKAFLINQGFVAIVAFVFMRAVATILIFMDEFLPFDINLDLRFFKLNILTLLFFSQIVLVIFIYNYLKINLKDKLKDRPLLEMLVLAIYAASLWTLTSP